jgi:hypothetical protein
MRIYGIAVDAIVEAHINGRAILGRVTEIKEGTVYFEPACRGAG